MTAVCNVPSFWSDSKTGYSPTHSAKQREVCQTSSTTISVATESSLSCITFFVCSFSVISCILYLLLQLVSPVIFIHVSYFGEHF